MAKRDKVTGLPLIQAGNCPAGGDHEDLPQVRVIEIENSPDNLIEYFCLKCRLIHWAVFPKEKRADPVLKTEDEHELFDGVPHA